MVMTACNVPVDNERVKQELLSVDREFSDYSVENGKNAAFLKYLYFEGVILRPGYDPIVGKEIIEKLFERENDAKYTLSWKPLKAEVAASGDLGYTYGIYELKTDSISSKGTYLSVWKKDDEENWKLVIDSGNEGIGKTPN